LISSSSSNHPEASFAHHLSARPSTGEPADNRIQDTIIGNSQDPSPSRNQTIALNTDNTTSPTDPEAFAERHLSSNSFGSESARTSVSYPAPTRHRPGASNKTTYPYDADAFVSHGLSVFSSKPSRFSASRIHVQFPTLFLFAILAFAAILPVANAACQDTLPPPPSIPNATSEAEGSVSVEFEVTPGKNLFKSSLFFRGCTVTAFASVSVANALCGVFLLGCLFYGIYALQKTASLSPSSKCTQQLSSTSATGDDAHAASAITFKSKLAPRSGLSPRSTYGRNAALIFALFFCTLVPHGSAQSDQIHHFNTGQYLNWTSSNPDGTPTGRGGRVQFALGWGGTNAPYENGSGGMTRRVVLAWGDTGDGNGELCIERCQEPDLSNQACVTSTENGQIPGVPLKDAILLHVQPGFFDQQGNDCSWLTNSPLSGDFHERVGAAARIHIYDTEVWGKPGFNWDSGKNTNHPSYQDALAPAKTLEYFRASGQAGPEPRMITKTTIPYASVFSHEKPVFGQEAEGGLAMRRELEAGLRVDVFWPGTGPIHPEERAALKELQRQLRGWTISPTKRTTLGGSAAAGGFLSPSLSLTITLTRASTA
jgi:hypothetical protein